MESALEKIDIKKVSVVRKDDITPLRVSRIGLNYDNQFALTDLEMTLIHLSRVWAQAVTITKVVMDMMV